MTIQDTKTVSDEIEKMQMLSIESVKKSRHTLFKPCGSNYNLK